MGKIIRKFRSVKTLFSLCIILGFIVLAKAQDFGSYIGDTLNFVDKENKKQAYWIIYDKENQTKLEEGKYQNNRKVGVWKKYFGNGNVKQEVTYDWNYPNGKARFYYENGTLREEGTWKMDRWIGNYVYYYPNGRPQYEWSYNSNGQRNGLQKYYYKNGQVMVSGNWENGKKTGTITEYYNDGSKKSEKKYKAGLLQAKSVKTYKRKAPVAVVVKDTVKDEQISEDDPLDVFDGNGFHRLFYKNMLLAREGYFKDGKLIDGKRYFYSKSGELKKVKIFENGKVVKVMKEDIPIETEDLVQPK